MSSAEAIVNLLLDEGQEEFAFDHGIEVSPGDLARSSGVIVSPDDFGYERQSSGVWAPLHYDEPFYDTVRYRQELDHFGQPAIIGTLTLSHDSASGDPIWSFYDDTDTEHEFTDRFSAAVGLLRLFRKEKASHEPFFGREDEEDN